MMSSLNCSAAIVLLLVKTDETNYNGRCWIKRWVCPVLLISEASLGPYAWEYKPAKKMKFSDLDTVDPNPENLPVTSCAQTGKRLVSEGLKFQDTYLQNADVANLHRSQYVFRRIELDPCMSLKLAKPGSTAGTVLKHCALVFEDLFEKQKPMTFKFGISHDPCLRWHCSRFGYKHGRERFGGMTVLYTASNPHGPAFLEAALIDRYSSFLIACYLLPYGVVVYIYDMLHKYVQFYVYFGQCMCAPYFFIFFLCFPGLASVSCG